MTDGPVWDADSRALIDWYGSHRSRFPKTPFRMAPWARVTEPDRFFAMLDQDIARGPLGPRGRRCALQDDLRRLRELFGDPVRLDAQKRLPIGLEAAAL
jgi:hypothetical protein